LIYHIRKGGSLVVLGAELGPQNVVGFPVWREKGGKGRAFELLLSIIKAVRFGRKETPNPFPTQTTE
jgi:hypothetical protein